jgi:ATP-dependent phosphofructokinase / diphosphate-dependent phosphofructokinase
MSMAPSRAPGAKNGNLALPSLQFAVVNKVKRVAIVFSGGPAPAANAVIAAAASSFLEAGAEVLGIFHGYTNLQEYDPVSRPMLESEHYRFLTSAEIRGLRNSRGVIIGTARVNPGASIDVPSDLLDPEKTERLRRIYRALRELKVDALISIGGDDTLKTANFLYQYQRHHVPPENHIRIVHLPKTIDNDYRGIDFTFGFFTAVDVMAKELLNLRADCSATSSYFIVETMGRKAGWLSYGVAIAGEADMVLSTEDVFGDLAIEVTSVEPVTGEQTVERRLSITALVDRIVDLIIEREKREQYSGTVVLAEGLAELLPQNSLVGMPRDEHGHIRLSAFDFAKMVSDRVQTRYEERTGRRKKVRHIQLGYESRCSPPHAFDVMLASQLGIGAFRALVEEELDGYMVSVSGQLDLQYVEFSTLINPQTLQTEVRYIEVGSDFHKLARFLETRTGGRFAWGPGLRLEPETEKPPG